MCGILGIYFKDETKKVESHVLKDMCDCIQHRGPDDEGYFLDGNIGLGIRRLSVIDLLKGHQPIHNEDRTVWVILNGEIYNFPEIKADLINKGHIFYTDSDTEVIVHLYEEKQEKCVNILNGMFAFALFDIKKKLLFIARDRLGIKPLYYYNKNGIFMFASELKAFFGVKDFNIQVNLKSLYHFFSLNYIPAPETIFEDVQQLLPGHYLIVTKFDFKTIRYWDICFNGYMKDREDIIVEKARHLLKQSVKRMLKSDVPLGAFLSGGMDSSSLVSFITEFSSNPIKTFSVGFEEDSYDETYFSDIAARYFGTEHYKIVCRPSDIIKFLPKIIWHADNLLADPAMLPMYIVSKLAKEHVTVCISGDGGDELFVGYPTYLADKYLQYYKKIPFCIRKLIAKKIINFLPVSSKKLSFEYKAKKFIEGAEFIPEKAHYWWRTIFTDEEKKALFSESILEEIGAVDSYSIYLRQYNNCSDNNNHLFNKFMYADLKVWLTDNNLIRVDAMSMANSLEVRVPFLDHELAEFIAGVPPNLKMKNNNLKYLLKKIMQDKLPEQILKREKGAWHIPLAQWFHSDLKDHVSEILSDPKIIKTGFFKKNYIDRLLYEHFNKLHNHSFKIWGLLVFFHWYDTFY